VTPRMEIHAKIFAFLTGELAHKDMRQCISIQLLHAPGDGLRDEVLRSWTREEEPELFDTFIEGLATSILEITEHHTDAYVEDSQRYIVRMNQHLGARRIYSFKMLSSTHALNTEDVNDLTKEPASWLTARGVARKGKIQDESAVKCRRGGCGTIIEEFWKFCPSCGTEVSFGKRQQVFATGRAVKKPDRRSGGRRISPRRTDDKRKARLQ
jgi:hypothetical protein